MPGCCSRLTRGWQMRFFSIVMVRRPAARDVDKLLLAVRSIDAAAVQLSTMVVADSLQLALDNRLGQRIQRQEQRPRSSAEHSSFAAMPCT